MGIKLTYTQKCIITFSFISVFLIFHTINSFAAPKLSRHYTYRYFTTRDGLAQMQVLCAYQDKDGYIWFGTKGGVSRWDGISFKNYTSENGFPMGEVMSITEWNDRKLIFYARKMVILDQNDSVSLINIPDKLIFPGHAIRTINIDKENILILGLHEDYKNDFSYSRYNLKYNARSKKFTQIHNFKENVLGIFENYIITHNGLFVWKNHQFILKLRFPFEVVNATFDKGLKKLALISSKDPNKFQIFRNENGKLINTNKSINGGLERSIWLPDGTFLWLYRFNHTFIPNRKIRLHENLTYPNFSFIDKENNLWIGTENGLYNFFNLNIEEYSFNLGTPDNIWSILEDKNGTMWFGSYGNGLYTLNKKGDLKHIDFKNHYPEEKKLASNLIYMGSSTDQKNTVYIPNSNGVAKFVHGKFAGESDTRACLYAYYDKKTNEIMYSGIDNKTQFRGLFVGMNENKKFYFFEKGFPISIIRDGNGIVRVGAFRGTARLINNQLVSDTLKRDYSGVASMALDNQNRLWKATEKGIHVELQNGKEFRVSPKFITGAFTSIIVYKNKYLIAGGTNGFLIIDIEKDTDYEHLNVVNIGYDAGFTGLESGQNGICVDSEGYVWLATALNVLKFNPEKIFRNHTLKIPPLRLHKVSFSKNNIDWEDIYLNDNQAVEIPSGNLFYSFDYVANSISSPNQLRFKYRLKGLYDNWSTPVYHKSVKYTNLPYGSYVFEVMCSLDGEKWSPVVSSPEIDIVRPWYLKIPLIVLYFLLSVLLITMITRYLVKKKHTEKLTLIEKNKLENELRLNNLRSKVLPHFTKNVLSAIGHFAMTDNLKAGHYIAVFSRFTEMTLTLADKNYIELKNEISYIEKYLELEKMRFNDRFDFIINIDAKINRDTLIPSMILHTYCDNAIRHGLVHKKGKGTLTVSILKKNDCIEINIEDDGIGRKRAQETGTRGNGIGLSLIEQNIEFYNTFNDEKIVQQIEDLQDDTFQSCGTKVTLMIPDNFKFTFN